MTNTDLSSLYTQHVKEREETVSRVLSETGFDRLVIHSGKAFTYFSDDQEAPLHRTPHFAHWTPVDGPRHLLLIAPGKRPRILRVTPPDFWYAPPAPVPSFVQEVFDVSDHPASADAWAALGNGAAKTAFIGEATDEAAAAGIPAEAINPRVLVSRLDWERSYKSLYEAETIAAANEIAVLGFNAAEACFRSGGSERDAHLTYLTACHSLERELPYVTIIGFDDRSATLHYQEKRGREAAPGSVMLVDAGVSLNGYGCDITRTYVAETAHEVFASLVTSLDELQRSLCDEGRPGMPYLDLHLSAHRGIAEILTRHGVLQVSAGEAFTRGLTRPFFPHGLGHFLGIQVHDVSGRFKNPAGELTPPPPEHAFLRTTRVIEERMLYTIEPGIYFIPMLLAPFRTGPDSGAFNWALINQLIPCGGIRIEDDIYVTADGNRNLTRPAFTRAAASRR